VRISRKREHPGPVVRLWGLDGHRPSGRARRLLVWPSRTVWLYLVWDSVRGEARLGGKGRNGGEGLTARRTRTSQSLVPYRDSATLWYP
jgi:hypothetical protein